MTDQLTEPVTQTPSDEGSSRRRLLRLGLAVLMVGFAAFWVWALFFASREGVNVVNDRAWAANSEQICLDARGELGELTDLTWVDEPTPELVREHADRVDLSTDVLERMIDKIEANPPADEKGRAVVPLWIEEYRTYLGNRRTYADSVRDSGEKQRFFETRTEGNIPISERLETFAVENEMPSCGPPRDLS